MYELDNTRAHQFAWAYLLNYPGVVFLKNRTLHDSRAAALDREDRMDDYRSELRFSDDAGPMTWKGQHHTARGSWPMLRVPLLASRSVVVPHASVARSLQEEYPEARVRYAPSTRQLPGSNFQQTSTSQAAGLSAIGVLGSTKPPRRDRTRGAARARGGRGDRVDDG